MHPKRNRVVGALITSGPCHCTLAGESSDPLLAGVSSLVHRPGKRILESKAREAREVTVRRRKEQAVLDGERGEMRIGNQIRARGRLGKKAH